MHTNKRIKIIIDHEDLNEEHEIALNGRIGTLIEENDQWSIILLDCPDMNVVKISTSNVIRICEAKT